MTWFVDTRQGAALQGAPIAAPGFCDHGRAPRVRRPRRDHRPRLPPAQEHAPQDPRGVPFVAGRRGTNSVRSCCHVMLDSSFKNPRPSRAVSLPRRKACPPTLPSRSCKVRPLHFQLPYPPLPPRFMFILCILCMLFLLCIVWIFNIRAVRQVSHEFAIFSLIGLAATIFERRDFK